MEYNPISMANNKSPTHQVMQICSTTENSHKKHIERAITKAIKESLIQ